MITKVRIEIEQVNPAYGAEHTRSSYCHILMHLGGIPIRDSGASFVVYQKGSGFGLLTITC